MLVNMVSSDDGYFADESGLKEVPDDIPSTVPYAFMSRNSIKYIPAGVFRNLSVCKWLDLSENKISDINFDTFDGLYHLKQLMLHDNRLGNISEGVFSVFIILMFSISTQIH